MSKELTDDEYKELVRKSDKLDKIMSDSATNQGDCQQIVEDNLNRQIERLQKQLEEANDLLKAYSTESLWESLSLSYDEAKDYCKKWGVK